MKRIAKALVIVALASSTATAMAADSPFPWAGQGDNYNATSVFPNMETYATQHRDSALSQLPLSFPSAALDQVPLSSEFPDIQTYQDIHRNDPVALSSAPTFPYSVSEEPSMADEGLVPGIAGVPPYVAPQQETTAVGATD